MVENIEELGTKTKTNAFGERELSLQRNISLPGAETPQHVASKVALLPCGCLRESCSIQNLATRKLRAKKFKRHSRGYVRTGRELSARRKESATDNVDRSSSSGKNKTVQRPIAKYGSGEFLTSRRG